MPGERHGVAENEMLVRIAAGQNQGLRVAGWRASTPRSYLVLVTPAEGVGDIIVTAAAAEEHQRHQPAADEKGEESSEAKRDPAVLAHFDAAAGSPDRESPNAREE